MAKFLDKKERVIDFELTPYGKQRLSVGRFKPIYYAFFDDGILYDSKYAGFSETQNAINERIKDNTQFIEGILTFSEIENFIPAGNYLNVAAADIEMDPADIDISPVSQILRTDKFTFESAIGDARFDSDNNQYAPATKIVTCQGEIINIATKDSSSYDFTASPADVESRQFNIPQIDIQLYYTKMVVDPTSILNSTSVTETINQTLPFADGKVIKLERNDLVVYAEEINTELLTENYDIEIFEILTGSTTKLEQKYFRNVDEQIVDGMMVSKNHKQVFTSTTDQKAVEFYFDVLTDKQINAKIACGCANSFNSDSFYVDIDFDCEATSTQELYYDIYGTVTVPEICDPDSTTTTTTVNEDGEEIDTEDTINCEDN
jgi:hypothetical protein